MSLTNVGLIATKKWVISLVKGALKKINPNEYSTDETIIGRWINGKPIYRKVFVKSDGYAATSTRVFESLGISDVDDIVHAEFKYRFPDGNQFSNEYLQAENKGLFAIYGEYSGHRAMLMRTNGYAVASFYAIVEYTKTTD